MPTPQLRVFSENATVNNHPVVPSSMVPVSLGDVVPLLLHASRTNRYWLEDFADESLAVSQDLYQILLAYKPIAEQSRWVA